MKINTVGRCARCGGDHNDLEIKPLVRPGKFTHYTYCPETLEPMLVTISNDDDEIDHCGVEE